MPIHIYWDNDEKTIIRADFDSDWTWADYEQSHQKLWDFPQSSQFPVHRIVDMRQTKRIPEPSALLKAMQLRSVTRIDERIGLTLLVGAPKTVEIFTKSLNRVYGTGTKRIHVATLEEAYEQIKKYRHETSTG